jgi:FAD/FMN-containing dehydrogenase
VQAALDLLVLCRGHFHDSINAFESMAAPVAELIFKHFPDTRYPLAQRAPHYAWVELADASPDAGLRDKLEAVLAEAMEKGIVLDAALAGSSSERLAIWQLREEVTDAQQREGASIKNDVTVPVSKTPEFILRATAECERRFPGIRVMAYGHLGDGNTHFNLTVPIGGDNAAFMKRSHEIQEVVNEIVHQFDGSFSAEHGIGTIKSYLIERWRGGAELDAMRKIKQALDPLGIMNPGKMLP